MIRFILKGNPPLFSVFEFYQALFKVFDPHEHYNNATQQAINNILLDEYEYRIVDLHDSYYFIRRDVYCFHDIGELHNLIEQPRNIVLEAVTSKEVG